MERGRYALIYTGWIALCAILFAALSGAEDPSRRHDRILSNDAGVVAQRILQKNDHVYLGYDVVHVAYAGKNEGGTEPRWVVLLDSEPHSALHKAVVVELRASDGRLIRIRKPVE